MQKNKKKVCVQNKDFLAGAVVLIPIRITLYVTLFIINIFKNTS